MILYGPYAVTPGNVTTIQVTAFPDTRGIIIMNESPYMFLCQIAGVGVWGVAAQTQDCCLLPSAFTGSINISCADYLATSNQSPSYVAFVQTFGVQDSIYSALSQGGSAGYPISLPRLQSIGNQVNTNTVSTQNTLVNDGSAIGTQIIEATPATRSASAVKLSNDGVMTLGDTTNKQGQLTVNGNINGTITFDNNNIPIASKWKLLNGGTTPGITTDASGNLLINVPSTTSVAQFNGGGLDLSPYGTSITAQNVKAIGQFRFNNGNNLTAVSHFSGTYGTSAGGNSIAHGLGTTPDICLLTTNLNNGSTTYSCTWDATNCHAFANNADAFVGVAIKF